MNLKRAIGFGIMLWIFIFVFFSIIIFIPPLIDKALAQSVIFWIFLIPTVLLLAKWYFKMDPPNLKKGLYLGLIGVVVDTVLDSIITIPLFVKSYAVFFGDWKLYVGYALILGLSIFAGGEFDATFTKSKSDN